MDIPPEACLLHDCGHCIKAKKSYVVSDTFQLQEPSRFLVKPDSSVNNSVSTFYKCQDKQSQQVCECTNMDSCDGDIEICKILHCNAESNCFCKFTLEKANIYHITEEQTIMNPMIITFEICLYDKRIHSRKLLEAEVAEFTEANISMTFTDPVLRLSDVGTIILRTDEYEHVMTVPVSKEIIIPFEVLAYKTILSLIYIHPSGKIIKGDIKINGKTACQVTRCVLCWEAMRAIKCWPFYIQYMVYATIIIITLIIICLFRVIVRSGTWIIKSIGFVIFLGLKTTNFLIRLCLLIGTYFGENIRKTATATHNILERGANVGVILTFFMILGMAVSIKAECSEQAIMYSESEVCEHTLDGFHNCKISITAEITLRTIGFQSCIWLRAKNGDQLLSLKIKFVGVQCEFATKRKYYTFPVQARHISQITCSQNRFCSYGKWCYKEDMESTKQRFESETQESRDFPGITTCEPSTLANGCYIIHRSACAFRRTYYKPVFEDSFEVSEITSHFCKYNLAVEHTDNGTVTFLEIKETEYTPSGIRLTILGAFNQPVIHLTESLVRSISRPEAYLVHTSQTNIPKVGEVGEIQGNSSYTKHFIFDKAISSCDFYEDRLRCLTNNNALSEIRRTKEKAIPISKGLHLFRMHKGRLVSDMLLSSAIKVQLQFNDYKVTMQKKTICPKIGKDSITTTGCYNCGLLARITLRAQSTCEIGVAEVLFDFN